MHNIRRSCNALTTLHMSRARLLCYLVLCVSRAVLSIVLGAWSVRCVGRVDWVDCRCFLSFVFLGGARRLELSPCNTQRMSPSTKPVALMPVRRQRREHSPGRRDPDRGTPTRATPNGTSESALTGMPSRRPRLCGHDLPTRIHPAFPATHSSRQCDVITCHCEPHAHTGDSQPLLPRPHSCSLVRTTPSRSPPTFLHIPPFPPSPPQRRAVFPWLSISTS